MYINKCIYIHTCRYIYIHIHHMYIDVRVCVGAPCRSCPAPRLRCPRPTPTICIYVYMYVYNMYIDVRVCIYVHLADI